MEKYTAICCQTNLLFIFLRTPIYKAELIQREEVIPKSENILKAAQAEFLGSKTSQVWERLPRENLRLCGQEQVSSREKSRQKNNIGQSLNSTFEAELV